MFGKWRQKKVVSEATNYIKAADSVNRPMAILLGLLSLVIIASLLFGLFLGGRWVYNKFQDDEPGKINTEQTESSSNDDSDSESDDSSDDTDEIVAPAPTPAPASTPAPAPQTTQRIPNTGPSEE